MKNRPILALLSLCLAACGSPTVPVSDGGSSIPDGGSTAAPTISEFTASPTSLPAAGGEVTLSWQQSGATSLSIDHGPGDVTGKQSVKVMVTTSTAFVLTATNSAGSAKSTATVTVMAAVMPTIGSFTATPTTLPVGGGMVHLAWTVNDAKSISIDGNVGDVTGLTSKDLHVTATTTFHLTATNEVGTGMASTTVTVAVPAQAPVISSFVADPTDLPDGGGSSTLRWSVTDAQLLSINHGVGDVLGLTSQPVTTTLTTEYTLTATNLHGSVTANATVRVPEPPLPVIAFLTASSTNLSSPDVVTLSWATSYATTISIDNGIGDVTGTTTNKPFVSHTTTFTMRAQNGQGTTSKSVTIFVQ